MHEPTVRHIMVQCIRYLLTMIYYILRGRLAMIYYVLGDRLTMIYYVLRGSSRPLP